MESDLSGFTAIIGKAQKVFLRKEVMPRKVEVLPYDPSWPSAFEEEVARLRDPLGEILVAIHHIGSTSIPSLAAKPIIDILLVDRDHGQLDARKESMIALGYEPKGEYGIPGRRYFRKCRGDVHLFHIHAFEFGHPEIARHLNFRDYLRDHPREAQAYQDLKQRLAELFPNEPNLYNSGKTDLIRAVDKRAAHWHTAL